MDNGCIYCVTCLVDEKKYIGKHLNSDPYIRWKDHRHKAKNGSKTPFHKALRKYGAGMFNWEVLYRGPRDTLNDKECYFADLYQSYIWMSPGGYNAIICGGGHPVTLSSYELSIQRRQSLIDNVKENETQTI